MKQSPCMNCTRPHKRMGCHSGCEDYKVYRAALDVIHNAKIAANGAAAEYGRERHMRSLKRMWRSGEL